MHVYKGRLKETLKRTDSLAYSVSVSLSLKGETDLQESSCAKVEKHLNQTEWNLLKRF
jgi:hypothetical protein